MAASRTIIVAGAGIGGLTASLALARQGFRIIILEKAAHLEEVGAGLQLSPNASRVLVDLGLGPRLSGAVAPEAISLMNASSGREITRIALDAKGFGADAPYWVVHRADLQTALFAEVQNTPNIDLRMGCQFEDVSFHANGLTVIQRRDVVREQEIAAMLIGADGLWSAVRGRLFPQRQPLFSGMIAWRGTLDTTQLPREHTSRRIQLWMGPHAHLVAYPIAGARKINVVAVVPGQWNRPGWSEAGDGNEIKGAFASAGWHAIPRMLIGAVDGWQKWALFAIPGDGEWTRGSAALLGDAAHAMLPFAAQGAAMAIEDAAVLAKCVAERQEQDLVGLSAALKRYARLRRPRVIRIQRNARQAGRIYHLSGPLALARDLVIKAMGPPRMLARQDWIYTWRA